MADADNTNDTGTKDHEDPSTHGYIQERDLDRNGVPDQTDEEEAEAAIALDKKMHDKNGNGVPDHLENKDDAQEHIVYDSNAHRNSPLEREERHMGEILAATHTPAEGSPDYKNAVKAAGTAASALALESQSKFTKDFISPEEASRRIRKLRVRRADRSSLVGDISRLPNSKSDPDNGFAILKSSWRGLLAGAVSHQTKNRAQRDINLQSQIDALSAANAEFNKAEAENKSITDNAPNTAIDKNDGSIPTPTEPENNGPESGGSADGSIGSPNDGQAADGSASEQETSSEPSSDATPADDKAVSADPALKNTGEVDASSTLGDTRLEAPTASATPVAGIGMQTNEALKAADQSRNEKKPEPQKDPLSEAPSQPTKLKFKGSGSLDFEGQRVQSLALSPTALEKGYNRAQTLVPLPMAERKGNLFDQARRFAPTQNLVESIGPSNPSPRTRSKGLGIGLTSFISTARAIAPRDTSVEQAQMLQSQRDSGGRER